MKVLTLLMLFLVQSSRAEDHIAVIKFAGLSADSDGVSAIYEKTQKGWRSAPYRHYGDSSTYTKLSDSPSACLNPVFNSLFKQAQIFAMNKFMKTGYLSKAEVESYTLNSVNFTDRPVTFYQYLSSEAPQVSFHDLTNDFTHLKVQYRTHYDHAQGTVMKDGYVKATLYTVSGQKLEHVLTESAPRMVAMDLPWMKDPEFIKELPKHFSREKFPLIWEIGRAASSENFEFPQLLAMAGNDILRELTHLGTPGISHIDHSYVSFHALNEENFDKFSKVFPGRVIMNSEKNSKNAVFMVPLKEYLEKFPPHRVVEAQRLMAETLGMGKAAKNQAFAELFSFTNQIQLDMRYQGKNLKTPVIFNTSTAGINAVPLSTMAHTMGYTKAEFDSFTKVASDALNSHGVSLDIAWPDVIVDPISSSAIPRNVPALRESNVFQIGNLDPVLAKNNPDYVISNLVSVFDRYVRQFVPEGASVEDKLPELIKEFKSQKIKFMITTQYPSTGDAIKSLMPRDRFKVDLTNDYSSKIYWDEMKRLSGGKVERPSKEMNGFVFDLDQILQLRYYIYKSNNLDAAKIPIARPGYHWWLQGAANP